MSVVVIRRLLLIVDFLFALLVDTGIKVFRTTLNFVLWFLLFYYLRVEKYCQRHLVQQRLIKALYEK